MKLVRMTAAGIRGFNEKQTVDLEGRLVIYAGPNASGKTTIGEAIEWLLYGKTLKRMKGDQISKREYEGSYQHTHYHGPGAAFVEAQIVDPAGTPHFIRRELKPDETSSLTVDGKPSSDLKQFGIGALYDRPLILQHTLQDFIFMKPKTRYEVLSAMLGLEPLIDFRNAVETAKTEFMNSLPARAREAQARAALLLSSLANNAILKPVGVAVQQGKLDEARRHLVYVGLGRVPPGTKEKDVLPALRQARAAKGRAKLDWGRFSLSPVVAPDKHLALAELGSLQKHLEDFERFVHDAFAQVAAAPQEPFEPVVKQFYEVGLKLFDEAHPEKCPFCLADTLTTERLSQLRKAVEVVPAARAPLSDARNSLRSLETALSRQWQQVSGLFPALPSEAEIETIKELATAAGGPHSAYLSSFDSVETARADADTKKRVLDAALKAAQGAITEGISPEGEILTLQSALESYTVCIHSLPGSVNGYAATYAALDPFIKNKLASEEDVRFLGIIIDGLEQWCNLEILLEIERIQEELQDLIRQGRRFVEKKQKEILGLRDQEIRNWYQLLSGGADVRYDCIVPGTDNIELRARTFTKAMMAAPNLSQSQLNCVGLAVYLATATRKGSPFRFILFDDPIQSMDDEHTEACRKQVIRKLLDEGFQVILLTHMENFADSVERLYRLDGAVLFRMEAYTQSGPNIVWKGPEIKKLLNDIKKNKDSPNDGYRKQAVQSLRQFVEKFVKDFYTAETGKPISKRFEDKSWPQLHRLLRQCQKFEPKHEPILEDTHNFTSPYLHTDDTLARKVPSGSNINPHYDAMQNLLQTYDQVFCMK